MNIFITGGSRGLGRAVVLEAARRGIGVAFTYRTSESGAADVLAEATKLVEDRAPIKMYELDVRDSAQVESVVDQACDEMERIDGVVNNAGVIRDGMAFSMSDEDWRYVIDTNVTGTFFVTRQFLGHFVANRHGHFVHISSLVEAGSSGQINYATSKAALVGLSGTIAKEYGPKCITSNVIVAGFIDGGMAATDLSERLAEFWHTFCPLRRVGSGVEFANLVLFLAGPESNFINGESLHLTGGLTYSP